jgi:hypothetical protein
MFSYYVERLLRASHRDVGASIRDEPILQCPSSSPRDLPSSRYSMFSSRGCTFGAWLLPFQQFQAMRRGQFSGLEADAYFAAKGIRSPVVGIVYQDPYSCMPVSIHRWKVSTFS